MPTNEYSGQNLKPRGKPRIVGFYETLAILHADQPDGSSHTRCCGLGSFSLDDVDWKASKVQPKHLKL